MYCIKMERTVHGPFKVCARSVQYRFKVIVCFVGTTIFIICSVFIVKMLNLLLCVPLFLVNSGQLFLFLDTLLLLLFSSIPLPCLYIKA